MDMLVEFSTLLLVCTGTATATMACCFTEAILTAQKIRRSPNDNEFAMNFLSTMNGKKILEYLLPLRLPRRWCLKIQ